MKKFFAFMLITAMMLTISNFTAFAAEEIVITTADSLCKLEGSGWTESTNEKVAGPTGNTSCIQATEKLQQHMMHQASKKAHMEFIFI